MYLTCVPAYGRDYKSCKEVKADWDANKDFQISDPWFAEGRAGRYINKADAQPGMTLNIRFKRLANICVIKVK